jgi:hypothetical protein
MDNRKVVYEAVGATNPKRWAVGITGWNLPERVWLNPEKGSSPPTSISPDRSADAGQQIQPKASTGFQKIAESVNPNPRESIAAPINPERPIFIQLYCSE